MFKGILLAVDGSEHALNAARTAGELARILQVEMLRIVIAYDAIPSYLGEPNLQQAIDARLEESRNVLKAALEAVGPQSFEPSAEMIEGSAAEAIIRVADTRQSDLIVMGSRGLGGLTGLLLGSTSQRVISHAPCPVLIIR